MNQNDMNIYIESLEISWKESQHEMVFCENLHWIDDIEREYYETVMFEDKFTDSQIETMLDYMGY